MKFRFAHLLSLLVIGLLAACQKPYHEENEHYVFVAFNTTLPYFHEAEAGLNDAAKQMGIKADFTGPASFAPEDELNALQQAIAQKPSGILVSASSPDILKAPIDAAIQQGIPVICVDADAPDSHRIMFIGTDNFRAGQESGKRIAGLLKGHGNVVVITNPGQFNLAERMRGVDEALKKAPGIKVTKTVDDKGDPRIANDNISTLVQGKEKPDGILCLEASGGEGAAEALYRVNLTGKIAIVAFDRDPETLDWIDRGAITATVAQKPYVMGYYGLRFLDDLHHNVVHEFKDWRNAPASPMPAWVDTGTAIIDKTNLAAFREALAEHPRPM